MNAFIAYLCNDNYLPGVICLIKSLKYHKNKNEIVILTTKDVSKYSKEKIKLLGAKVKEIEEIHYQGSLSKTIKDRYGKQNNSWMVFTKINIWKETNYNKILYIDADAIVLGNIDFIFDIDSDFSAVLGGSKFLKYNGIESGVLLIKPSLKIYYELIEAMNSDKYNLIMSDQSLINDYFLKNYKINYLDKRWNSLQKKNDNIKNAYIYHYNGSKPWINKNIQNSSVWFAYYNL